MEPTTRVAKVLNKPNDAPVVRHGTVESVDGDTLQVLIDNTASPITCARACVCVQGDRVVVVGKDAIATVGANYGGGGGISILDVYPIGSIYMSVNSTDPGVLFGGTWQRIQDTFLLAAGSTYSAGDTGGDAEVTLTAAQSGIPAHTHSFTQPTVEIYGTTDTASGSARSRYHPVKTSGSTTYNMSVSGGAVGAVTGGAADASAAHNNMPPYLVVYVWQRTA